MFCFARLYWFFKGFYKRKLPHITPVGYAFFITARLYGSLPYTVIKKLKDEKEENERYYASLNNTKIRKVKFAEIRKEYFIIFDEALIKYSNGPYWLKEKAIAEIVYNAIIYRDGSVYNLISFTIMPNHIHIILQPLLQVSKKLSYKGTEEEYILGKIMGSLKQYTANESNKILNRKGEFWQHESYDHIIRNYKELIDTVKYILNNPVKAGLCNKAEDWKWNYCNYNFLSL